ncbi:YtfJ family protein [Pantoea sp. C2G6]|uniref:YtfJ family protein n=1 Tax=Pantoea sp. C2G6 TaxID=3243084 RepID=UPI003ED9118F
MIALLFSGFAAAHTLIPGQPVPGVFIADKGEMVMDQNEIDYRGWNSQRLTGKVRLVIHVAGRLSAKDQSEPLIRAIQQASFPRDRFQTTTIINTDDALPGSAIFVVRSIASSKKASPWQQFIIDTSGVTAHSWQLKPESAAVFVVDPQGIVRFAKEGALSSQDVSHVMDQLRALLG